MKRIVIFCLVFLLLFPLCLPAVATSAHLSLNATVFAEGDAILVTAEGSGADWIGIVPRNGDTPDLSRGAIRWKYIAAGQGSGASAGAGSGIATDIRTGTTWNVSKFGSELIDIPAGDYAIIFVPANGAASTATESINITVVKGKLTTNKTTYVAGEPIMVSAIGEGADWIGIVPRNGDTPDPSSGAIRWKYIAAGQGSGVTAGAGSGVAADIRTGKTWNVSSYGDELIDIPAGEYSVLFIPNNQTAAKYTQSVPITVIPRGQLTSNKTEYNFGEPILITANGFGTDWVGIAPATQEQKTSALWEYVKDIDELPFDIRTASHQIKGQEAYFNIPAGEYNLVFVEDDKVYASASETLTITVLDTPAPVPDAPIDATYILEHDTDGFADGAVSVRVGDLSSYDAATDVVMYWGTGSGRLPGYTSLAKHKITGEVTVFAMAPHTLIPSGATELMIYTSNEYGLSSDCFTVALPSGAAAPDLGAPLLEFQVGSDLHLTGTAGDLHAAHTEAFLRDVAENSPDSAAIIINGDLADCGTEAQYAQFADIVSSILAEYGEDALPMIRYAMGNHELFDGKVGTYGEFATQLARYLTGASVVESGAVTEPYREFFINGYHFIFLSNEQASGKAYLSENQLNWLSATLAANKNAAKPTFLFLHQPMSNTVAGSYPDEGWAGVVSETELRAVLANYPEVIFFNGHTHWDMNSPNNLYYRGKGLPTILNTAAVGYLWSSYNKPAGEYLQGSQCYYIRVYENQTVILGKDLTTGEWIPGALYSISYTPAGYEEYPDSSDGGVTLEGVSLTPGDPIGLNVCFSFGNAPAVGENIFARFVFPNGRTEDVSIADAVRRMTDGKVSFVFTAKVAAAQMADTVAFQLWRNGAPTGETHFYSVMEYAANLLANEAQYPQAAPLIKAMLYYGSLAGAYFAHGEDVAAILSESDLADLCARAEAMMPDSAYAAVKSGTLTGLAYVGSSLLLDSAVTVRHYFKPDAGVNISDFTFTADGKTLTPVQSGEYWYVDICGFSALTFGDAATLCVGDFTLSYSPMSYVYSVLCNESRYGESLVSLLRGMALYYAEAAAYFQN